MLMLMLSIFAMFLVVNFVANTALRNQTSGMAEILYSEPINPVSYQLRRLLGSSMPWVDASRYGPTELNFYFSGFIYYTMPSLFLN